MGQCCSIQNDKASEFYKLTNSENLETIQKPSHSTLTEPTDLTQTRKKGNKAVSPVEISPVPSPTFAADAQTPPEALLIDQEVDQIKNAFPTTRGGDLVEQPAKTIKVDLSRIFTKYQSINEQIPSPDPVHTPHPQVATRMDVLPNLTNLYATQTINKLGIFVYNTDHQTLVDFSASPVFQFVETQEIYRGEWQNGKRHGKGEQLWPDGSVYQGHWRDDQRYGRGRWIGNDGEMYDGEWRNDQFHKRGVYISKSGVRYSGDFKEGEKHGMGKEEYTDHTKYEGPFQHGLKEGHGMMTLNDTGVYLGDFKGGKMCGEGVLEWPDGRKYMGQFRDDKMHGVGEFTWPDGRRYKGEYEYDQKNGQGEFYWPDTRVYKGAFRDNQMHGEGYFTSQSGHTRKGVWDFGQRVKWL